MDITTFRFFYGVSGNARPMSQTFTSNGTIVIPAGTASVDMVGNGARGTNGTESKNYIYETKTIYATRKSTGERIVASQSRYLVPFTGQSAYCGPLYITPSDPNYSDNQTCYGYDGFFTSPGNPPTTGASATGLGKTFPGSTGSGTPPTTTFTAVPVTAGTYNIVVPSGGSLTISYYG